MNVLVFLLLKHDLLVFCSGTKLYFSSHWELNVIFSLFVYDPTSHFDAKQLSEDLMQRKCDSLISEDDVA